MRKIWKSNRRTKKSESLQSYAWRFFMMHYRVRRNGGGTGVGYLVQIFISQILATLILCYVCLTGFRGANIPRLAFIVVILLVWMLHSIKQALLFMDKAGAFAKRMGEEAKDQSDVRKLFDETYPWVFL